MVLLMCRSVCSQHFKRSEQPHHRKKADFSCMCMWMETPVEHWGWIQGNVAESGESKGSETMKTSWILLSQPSDIQFWSMRCFKISKIFNKMLSQHHFIEQNRKSWWCSLHVHTTEPSDTKCNAYKNVQVTSYEVIGIPGFCYCQIWLKEHFCYSCKSHLVTSWICRTPDLPSHLCAVAWFQNVPQNVRLLWVSAHTKLYYGLEHSFSVGCVLRKEAR